MRLIPAIVVLLLGSALARADGVGVPVSPDTPSTPPPPPPPRASLTPPDCVNKILETIYEREKTYFETKKAYSDSLLEIRALSAIGLGCPGWDLPVVRITYGGSGYTAEMNETSSGNKWLINQDKLVTSEEKKIVPVYETPTKK